MFHYLKDGLAVELIQELNDGKFLVKQIYEVDDGWFADGQPFIVDAVYEKAPVEMYQADIASLIEQLARKKEESYQLDKELREKELERNAKLKKFPILDNLEKYLDGKIEYVVIDNGNSPPEISSISSLVSSERDRDLRLLTLSGKVGRENSIAWVINRYSDGSGHSNTVWPCCSIEEANEVVVNLIHACFKKEPSYYSKEWIKLANFYSVDAPSNHKVYALEQEFRNLNQNIESEKRQAERYAEQYQSSLNRQQELAIALKGIKDAA